MPKLITVCCCLVLLSVTTTACGMNRVRGKGTTQEQPTRFATPEEAVSKAKADFLSVLRSNAEVKLGVDAATLERAHPDRSVRRVDLDFAKVLAADSTQPFDALVRSERNTVVPFVADADVVTIVEVARDEQGWKVVGLAGKDIADDLTIVRRAVGDTAADIILYEVPNLQTRVYGVKRDGADVLFTDFGNRFSLRQGVSAAVLVPALKAAAVEFQRQYGDIIRKQQLLR